MSTPRQHLWLALARRARLVPAVLAALLLVTGLAGAPWAATPALLLLVLLLGWLARLSWPALHPAGRAVRVMAVLLLLGIVVARVS